MFDMTGMYILLGGFLLLGAGLVALYVLRALGLYRLARNAGMPCPVLAWVPVANWYLLGCLCDRAAWFRAGKRWNFALWLPILNAIGSPWIYLALSEMMYSSSSGRVYNWLMTSGVQGLLGLGATVLSAVALYYFYCDYAPEQVGLYTVLSVVVSFGAPQVLLFMLRNRVPCSVTGVVPPPAAQGRTCYTTGPGQYQGGQRPAAPRQTGGTTGWPPPQPPAGTGTGSAGQSAAGYRPRNAAPPSSAPGWAAQSGGNCWQPGGSDGDYYQSGGYSGQTPPSSADAGDPEQP